MSLPVVVLLSSAAICSAADSVMTEVVREPVWTGQAVPMSVTLYAPGPFSGAASFDVPEIPRTVITTAGSPVVGSEKVDGKTYFTQRHTFHVYTQRTGKVTIPSFTVRFEWKEFSASEATSIVGTSPEQTFECRRPPGTEDLGIVIACEQLSIEQEWTPDEAGTVSAGDLIQRRIEIDAVGTTAMMLPQVSSPPQDGIRVYTNNPEVSDKTQRGETSAQRVDVVKYQFEHPGVFKLPEHELIWWDVREKELRKATVPGKTINVSGVSRSRQSDVSETATVRRSYRGLAVTMVLVVVCWMFQSQIRNGFRHFRDRWRTPESLLADRVITACRSNDPNAAYSALLEWLRIMSVTAMETGCEALDRETKKLATRLYASTPENGGWNGDSLRLAVRQARSRLRYSGKRSSKAKLPALNPTSPIC